MEQATIPQDTTGMQTSEPLAAPSFAGGLVSTLRDKAILGPGKPSASASLFPGGLVPKGATEAGSVGESTPSSAPTPNNSPAASKMEEKV